MRFAIQNPKQTIKAGATQSAQIIVKTSVLQPRVQQPIENSVFCNLECNSHAKKTTLFATHNANNTVKILFLQPRVPRPTPKATPDGRPCM